MKKILLILTGGTICSTGDSDNLNRALDVDKAKTLLAENFASSGSIYAQQQFVTESVLSTLSENMTIECWNKLLKKLKEFNLGDYKGIVVAHGTDTLAYTACFLSLALSELDIPVFLVSSNLPLDTKGANGNVNFRQSVELICSGITAGTYVVYRNSDNNVYLHNAAHLRQCDNYTDDFFSADMKALKTVEGARGEKSKNCPIKLSDIPSLRGGVMKITPYVGLDYSQIKINSSTRIVVHQLYHSETACTQEGEADFSTSYLIKQCESLGVDVIFTPVRDGKPVYESGEKLKGIHIYGLTPEMTYVKAVVATSLGYSGEQLSDFMKKNVCNEFIC